MYFNAKPQAEFDPYAYFSAKNIERKKLQNLPLYDVHDLPVNTGYVAALKPYCDSITYVSRWMNAAAVYCDAANIAQLKALPFVTGIEIPGLELNVCGHEETTDLHPGELNLLKAQTTRMQTSLLRAQKITGQGVTIAIIDAGFNGYEKNTCLEYIRNNNQVKHTWDFIKKRKDVDGGSGHGTSVLSCIGGVMDRGVYMGCAPDANFLLYRTEKAFNEKLTEEEYWLAAVEEADRQGADIINTSLGYSTRRYFEKDMNGRKSILARAANLASRKGMLVVCSAGNEGDISWKTICTPGDADSALTVGAINPWTGVQASWSSYGPTADLRLKPNVTAFGFVMAADYNDGIHETQGTSFSSPLVAGFAACVRQMNPEITAWELMQEIQQSADLYPYYDYAHGYGVPQAGRFFPTAETVMLHSGERRPIPQPTFDIKISGDSLAVIINEDKFMPAFIPVKLDLVTDDDSSDRYKTLEDENGDLYRTFKGEEYLRNVHFNDNTYSGARNAYVFTTEPGLFYYKVSEAESHVIAEYAVLNVHTRNIFKAKKSNPARTYTFHYRGYTYSLAF